LFLGWVDRAALDKLALFGESSGRRSKRHAGSRTHMAGYKLATYQTADGPRAGLVIDDKVFDAAKLTGKGAYATVLGILADWRTAQGVLKKAAATAGKSRVKALLARARQALGAGALALGDLLRRRQLCRPRRRNGAPHEPADGARPAHAGAQGVAFLAARGRSPIPARR
jgi:hypothetical protein